MALSYDDAIGYSVCSWTIVASHAIFFVLFAIISLRFNSRVKAAKKNAATSTATAIRRSLMRRHTEVPKNAAVGASTATATATDTTTKAEPNHHHHHHHHHHKISIRHHTIATKHAKIQHLALFALICAYCALTCISFITTGVAFPKSYEEEWSNRVVVLPTVGGALNMFASDSIIMLIVFLYIYQWLSFINTQLKLMDDAKFRRVFAPLCACGGLVFFVLEILFCIPSYISEGKLTTLSAILFTVVFGVVDFLVILIMLIASIYIINAMKKAAASTESAARTDLLEQQRKRLRFSMIHQTLLIVLLIVNITSKPLGFALSVFTPEIGFYAMLIGRIPDWFFFGYLIFWYMRSFPRVFGLTATSWNRWWYGIMMINAADEVDAVAVAGAGAGAGASANNNNNNNAAGAGAGAGAGADTNAPELLVSATTTTTTTTNRPPLEMFSNNENSFMHDQIQRKGSSSSRSHTSSNGTRTTRGSTSRFKRWRQRWIPDSAVYIVVSNAASVVAFLLLGIIVLVLALFVDSKLYGHYKLSRQDNEIQRLNDLVISDLLFAVYTRDQEYYKSYLNHAEMMQKQVSNILLKLPADVVERYKAHDADRTARQAELVLLSRALVHNYAENPTASTVQGFLDQLFYLRDKGANIGIINSHIEKAYEEDLKVSRVLVVISSIVAFCAIPSTILVSIVTLVLNYKQRQKLMAVQSHFLHETLHDEKERERFIAFCKKEFSAENVLCWIEIAEFKQIDMSSEERFVKASRIYETYLAPNATEPVNIDVHAANEIKRTIALCEAKNTEININLFDALQQELETNMKDTHSRYKKFKNSLITTGGKTTTTTSSTTTIQNSNNELKMFKLTKLDNNTTVAVAAPTHASLELLNRPTCVRNSKSGDD